MIDKMLNCSFENLYVVKTLLIAELFSEKLYVFSYCLNNPYKIAQPFIKKHFGTAHSTLENSVLGDCSKILQNRYLTQQDGG